MNARKDKHTITAKLVYAESSSPNEMVAESRYHDEHSGGYSKNPITITRYKDGAVHFGGHDGAEDFIYLYPQQVKHLKQMLNKRFRGGGNP